MINIKNALSEEQLRLVSDVVNKRIYEHDTRYDRFSNLTWNPKIVKHSSLIYISETPELNSLLANVLKPYVHDLGNVHSNLYVWGKGSYIPFHDDYIWRFGATLYLNKDWDPEDGGLFVYEDSHTSEYKVILPEYNTLVINTIKENHHVTVVNSFAKQNRYTIQIFGK